MSHRKRIGRREFMMTSAGVLAAGLESACGGGASIQEIEQAASRVGPLRRRKLGGSGREITVLIGSATWAREAVEAAVRCDINYWHKADEWDRDTTPQAILKNREAHYCEICIDRVRGNHETGVLDEEAHVQFVKQTVERTGLRYFDDLMFHFGYHSVAELKSNRTFLRVFERLKKQGLVRHLCLSQHSYLGNRKVPGGDAAHDILTAVMAEGEYEHAQFAFTYGDSEAMNAYVAAARRKGFGTTAMKTTVGAGRMLKDREFMSKFPSGTTPHHALARWLTTTAPIDAAVIQINNLREFVDTYSGAGKPVRAADAQALIRMSEYADREVCRLCNQCMPHCEQAVPVADVLRFERYAQDYGEKEYARRLYRELDRQANLCVACGTCLPHCPQGLPIAAKLARAHRLLS